MKQYLLHFLTTDNSDFGKLQHFLIELEKFCGVDSQSFRISAARGVAGWQFSELFISGPFGDRLQELYSQEIERARSEIKGKFYVGKDQGVIKLVSWFNEKLKNKGVSGHVKIGEEMADLSYGRGAV